MTPEEQYRDKAYRDMVKQATRRLVDECIEATLRWPDDESVQISYAADLIDWFDQKVRPRVNEILGEGRQP